MMRRPRRHLALIVSLVLVGTLGHAGAQVQRRDAVQLYGRVQWIGAEKMSVITDCGFLENCARMVLSIDLRHVPLAEYRGVRAGSWVVVEGHVAHENGHHRVVASSVTQVEEEWEVP